MSRELYEVQNGLLTVQNGLLATDPQILVVDDFEHNDQSLWQTDGSGTFEIQSTTAFDGDYAAKLTNTERTWNHPNWGDLDYYPQSGDLWEFYIRFDRHDGQVRLYFARDDVDGFSDGSGYQLHLYSGGAFRLVNGIGDNIAYNYDVNYSLSTWYRVRHWWHHPEYAGDHVLQLYNMDTDSEVVIINGDDTSTSHNSGGVMLYTNNGATALYDQLQVLERTA